MEPPRYHHLISFYLFLFLSILFYLIYSLFSLSLCLPGLCLSLLYSSSPLVYSSIFSGCRSPDAEHLPFGLKHIDGNDLLGLDSLFLFSVPQLLSDLAPPYLRTL